MLTNTFYESGSVLTMADHKTYICEISHPDRPSNLDFKGQIFRPEFSLHQIRNREEIASCQIYPHEKNNFDNKILDQLKIEEWKADLITYQSKYTQIKELITLGEIKKAVPFMTYTKGLPDDFNTKYLPVILNRLVRNKPESEYVYGYWNQSGGFIGTTPEFLIQKKPESHRIQTMALAGTLPAHSPQNMLDDPKLKEEHRFVMDDISEKLNTININWEDPKEKIFGIVKHILATADFEIPRMNRLEDKKLNAEDGFKALSIAIQKLILELSPTSALGVYPKEKLKDVADLLEVETRGTYGAPFGYQFKDQFNVIVALRGLFWDKKSLSIHVGGGVTDKSVFQTEVEELSLKFLSTKNKLGV